ncbi:MFS transporter [Streptomyces sp. NPDC059928]|uniref:MFS transporter n=1 Tax=unclassified Streptomyces TaxID=2593676 RepID=UPI003646E59E
MSTPARTAGKVPDADAPDPRRWMALIVASVATLMVVLDVSIVNIALPQAQSDLAMGDANRQWMITAYALAFGGLLLLGGRIADFAGRKRILTIGLLGFAAASMLGGLAPNPGTLFIARALQGAFGALLAPAALSLITVAFTDPKERAKAFGIFGAFQGGGGAVGLLLGGVLTEYAGLALVHVHQRPHRPDRRSRRPPLRQGEPRRGRPALRPSRRFAGDRWAGRPCLRLHPGRRRRRLDRSVRPWAWNTNPDTHFPRPEEICDELALEPARFTAARLASPERDRPQRPDSNRDRHRRRHPAHLKPHPSRTPAAASSRRAKPSFKETPMADLFEPVTVGKWTLNNRIVMAPMTRNRATPDGVPTDLMATYYGQRATAGLIITEGVQPSTVGQGYMNSPGLHTPAQTAAWRTVADAVHQHGGHIVMQIMHAGRISHPDNKHHAETVAPSAIAAPGEMFTATGPQPHPTPRALGTDEIPTVIDEYAHAARAAVDAGLDGIELHAANGYLLHQFLAPNTNQRTDSYGGTPEARARFVIEVAQAVSDAIGSERVGIRISPAINLHGAIEDDADDTAATYRTLVDALSAMGLAYLHTIGDPTTPLIEDLAHRFAGPRIVSNGWEPVTDAAIAQALLDNDQADLVAVGRAFIANPDLVQRWQTRAPLNQPDVNTFYGGDHRGYTDYPSM